MQGKSGASELGQPTLVRQLLAPRHEADRSNLDRAAAALGHQSREELRGAMERALLDAATESITAARLHQQLEVGANTPEERQLDEHLISAARALSIAEVALSLLRTHKSPAPAARTGQS